MLARARMVPGLYSLLAFLTTHRVAVRGASMYPALHPGERLLFDRLAYRIEEPRVGDIVLARHPARPGVRFIKRIATRGSGIPPDPQASRIASGEYWLLGDNQDRSTDSRELGPFRREDILARAWLVYWPPTGLRRVHPA